MQALALFDGFIFTRVSVDRGYAAASFIASVQERSAPLTLAPSDASLARKETRMADDKVPPGVGEGVERLARSYEVWQAKFEAKYAALGGEASFLGKATSDLVAHPDHDGAWMQTFEHGVLCGDVPLGGVFEIHGAIYDKWSAVGGPGYGWPLTDESAGPGDGRYNHFTGPAEIYWSPETGAHVVYGAIRDKWFALGNAGGELGYPTTDEMDNIDNQSTGRGDRCQRFQGGYLSWNTESGAHVHVNGTVSRLAVTHLNIHSIRSRHRDTNVISLFARVPGQPDINNHAGLGDFGVGDYDINQAIEFVADDPTAPLNVSWLLVNHGDGDTKELDDKLHGTLQQVADKGAGALGAAVGTAIGGGVGGVIGAAVGAVLGYLAGLGIGALFVDCDGVVAGDTVFVSAATWNDAVGNGPMVVTKTYPGLESPGGCGDNSNYEVTWTES
jgi:LGFP repeat-containing protein